ncbi:MAG TPA: hypothetical protein VG937_06710 [Polyangiaceae bacterium]|nr:hypothetical protein [Polyangiaceae bacterium]
MPSGSRLVCSLLVALAGCAAPEARREPSIASTNDRARLSAPATGEARPPSAGPAPLPFIASQRSLSELPVPGFLPALVYQPAANEPRPLVVATHGAGGAPEGECAYWVRLTKGFSFVLCLRGTPFDRATLSSFYYKNHLELRRELDAALGAARAAFGARLSPAGGLYSGFSQGATMGVGMIPALGAELPLLVLIEGGYDYWSVAQAKKYRASGGRRVLFACGTKWCADRSEKSATWLRKVGIEARVEYAPGVGHTPMGEVMARVAEALPWVISENPGWEGLTGAR